MILVGWKAIAAFLGSIGGPCSERMARYLGEQGLPAYQTSRSGRVQAIDDDVRRWWDARKKLVGAAHVAEWCHRLPRSRSKVAKTKAA